jgi:hypothetical protein
MAQELAPEIGAARDHARDGLDDVLADGMVLREERAQELPLDQMPDARSDDERASTRSMRASSIAAVAYHPNGYVSGSVSSARVASSPTARVSSNQTYSSNWNGSTAWK